MTTGKVSGGSAKVVFERGPSVRAKNASNHDSATLTCRIQILSGPRLAVDNAAHSIWTNGLSWGSIPATHSARPVNSRNALRLTY